jgi:hypothetical protein
MPVAADVVNVKTKLPHFGQVGKELEALVGERAICTPEVKEPRIMQAAGFRWLASDR